MAKRVENAEELLGVRIRSGDLEKIDRAARAVDQTRSAFVRFVVLQAAEAVIAQEPGT